MFMQANCPRITRRFLHNIVGDIKILREYCVLCGFIERNLASSFYQYQFGEKWLIGFEGANV